MRKWVFAVAIITFLVVGFIVLSSSRSSESSLPNPTVDQASKFMTVYYYTGPPPYDFELEQSSVSLSGAFLTFKIKNDRRQSIVFTQQPLPSDLHNSTVQSGEKVEGAPGSATVTFKEGRVIGTLLSNDKKTMVVANSSDGIESSTMMDLMRNLKPLK